MRVPNFYRLEPPARTTRYAEWDEGVKLERIECPVHRGHQRAGRRTSTLSVVLPDEEIADFVWTWASELLASERVVARLVEEGITGFQALPVAVRLKKGRAKAPRLHEIRVTGWGGVAPESSGSRLDQEASCPHCGLVVYTGVADPTRLIPPPQWDGADIFMIWPLPRFVFASERVVGLIRREGWKGVKIRPLEDLEPIDGPVSPGRLSYYMPFERATALGKALGIS